MDQVIASESSVAGSQYWGCWWNTLNSLIFWCYIIYLKIFWITLWELLCKTYPYILFWEHCQIHFCYIDYILYEVLSMRIPSVTLVHSFFRHCFFKTLYFLWSEIINSIIYLDIYLSIYLGIYLSCHLSSDCLLNETVV